MIIKNLKFCLCLCENCLVTGKLILFEMVVDIEKQNLVYFVNSKMYINLTNLCTCKCVFCIRDLNSTVEGVDMHLENLKANPDKVIENIIKLSDRIGDEVVFCGYGEPMLELESLKKIAKFIKDNYKGVKIRVNTNGHANLVHKRDVLPELKGLIDSFSVSLNADNATQYKNITNCAFDAETGFNGMLNFIKLSVKNGIKTYASVVTGFDGAEINVKKCEDLAKSLGAEFRAREYLNEGYS